MFDHKNLALDGCYPGFVNNQSMVNLGVYRSEVTIFPVYEEISGGGGYSHYSPTIRKNPKYYIVIIQVFFDGKTYEEKRHVDEKEARIIAKLHGMVFKKEPIVAVNGLQILEQTQVEILINRIRNRNDNKD